MKIIIEDEEGNVMYQTIDIPVDYFDNTKLLIDFIISWLMKVKGG